MTATRDINLAGQSIRAGDRVLVMFGAVNYDANTFSHPTAIDPERTMKRHLAFGLGTHFCPGSPLARLEIELMVRELLQRLPAYRLVDSAAITNGVITNAQGWNAIHITTH